MMKSRKMMAVLNETESERFSSLATKSGQGIRRRHEARLDSDYRQPFSLDVDRILHSRAYARYIDKTQVFYLIQNDHITHRVLHVQLVSKIARTIGRFLRLNEDLIEAIALGHDIGHAPFGHDGERFLSDICQANGIGHFLHNIQSVQFLERVERSGKGWNLCLQTLDGILCHDGEIHNTLLEPIKDKTFESHDIEILNKKENPAYPLTPMTLEGCVVRMADTIAYIGRDIEDAIRLGVIRRADLPENCVQRLGETNGTIVYSLVTDVIENSFHQPYITFSGPISEALKELKQFNLEKIYLSPLIKKYYEDIKSLFHILFEQFLEDVRQDNRNSIIFSAFLENRSDLYMASHQPEEVVRDFIAGMTDSFFLRLCPNKMRPLMRTNILESHRNDD
jgi:dGTPase